MKVLSLSDQVLDRIYAPTVGERFGDVDLVLGCGDLPYYYLEYLVDQLEAPVFFVRGNHDVLVQHGEQGARTHPWGAIDLDRRIMRHEGLLIAGFEGGLRYRKGPYLYSQGEMWWRVLRLVPRLLWNRLIHGRALDVLVSHAPPRGLGDRADLAHRGFNAFRWLLRVIKPRYHFHGHIHVYGQDEERILRFGATQIVNSYGCLQTEINLPHLKDASTTPAQTGNEEGI